MMTQFNCCYNASFLRFSLFTAIFLLSKGFVIESALLGTALNHRNLKHIFLQLLKNLQNPSSLFKKRASWDFHCVNQAFTLLHNYNTCKLQHSYFNPVHHSSDFLHLLFIKMETYFLPSTTYSAIMVKYFLLMLTQLEICVSVEPATPTIYKTCWLKTSKAGRRFEKNIISGSRIC